MLKKVVRAYSDLVKIYAEINKAFRVLNAAIPELEVELKLGTKAKGTLETLRKVTTKDKLVKIVMSNNEVVYDIH